MRLSCFTGFFFTIGSDPLRLPSKSRVGAKQSGLVRLSLYQTAVSVEITALKPSNQSHARER